MKALVGIFSMIVKTDGWFAALLMTHTLPPSAGQWRHLALVSTCAHGLGSPMYPWPGQHQGHLGNNWDWSLSFTFTAQNKLSNLIQTILWSVICDVQCNQWKYISNVLDTRPGSIFLRTFKSWKQLQCATNSEYHIEWFSINPSWFWTDFNQYFVTCQ